MDQDDVRRKLRRAIERHLSENPGGAMVVNPEGLVERMLQELGLADSVSYNGWTIRRVIGKDIPRTPRGSRDRYGYVASKPGREDEVAEPCGGVDAPLSYFKLALDRIDSRHSGEE